MAKRFELADQKVRESIKEFILMMLGAPVVKIELDESQMDLCIKRTCEMMESSDKVANWSAAVRLMVAQDGALAHAKLMLGRVRAKFNLDTKGVNKTKSKISTNNIFPLDGGQLLIDGERQYNDWQLKVFGKIFEDKKFEE